MWRYVLYTDGIHMCDKYKTGTTYSKESGVHKDCETYVIQSTECHKDIRSHDQQLFNGYMAVPIPIMFHNSIDLHRNAATICMQAFMRKFASWSSHSRYRLRPGGGRS